MTIVDDRGRVAGRFNLVDMAVAIVILILIPVAYGAYLVFRTPPARLTGVFPDKVYPSRNMRVEITGENLRPFMRVSFNTVQGRSFLIGSTKYAQVDLPDLQPGVYDVELFDTVQIVDRMPKALTILPLAPEPTVDMQVAGKFLGLPAEQMAQIAKGTRFPPTGVLVAEVLSVGPPVAAQLRLQAGAATVQLPLTGQLELPATLHVRCFIAPIGDGSVRCDVPGPQHSAIVKPDSVLTLAGPQGWVSFQITGVQAPGAH